MFFGREASKCDGKIIGLKKRKLRQYNHENGIKRTAMTGTGFKNPSVKKEGKNGIIKDGGV